MTVTAEYAAEHFEELALAAEQGVEVEIVRPGKTSVSLRQSSRTAQLGPFFDAEGQRIAGTGKGFLRELTPAEWEALDRSTEHLLDGALEPQSA